MYLLKVICKEERTVGKANRGINVERIIGLKHLNIKIKKKINKKEEEKGKLHRTAKGQCEDRPL